MNYYWQWLDEVNVEDAMDWMNTNKMVGIVDERNGGIMGYMHEAHAELVCAALNAYKPIQQRAMDARRHGS